MKQSLIAFLVFIFTSNFLYADWFNNCYRIGGNVVSISYFLPDFARPNSMSAYEEDIEKIISKNLRTKNYKYNSLSFCVKLSFYVNNPTIYNYSYETDSGKFLSFAGSGGSLIYRIKKDIHNLLIDKCKNLHISKQDIDNIMNQVLQEHPILQEKFTQYDKLVKKQDDEINTKINILKNKYLKLINSKQKKCNHLNAINDIPYISELLKEEIENKYKEDKEKCKREVYNKYQKIFYKEKQKIIEEVTHKYEDQKKALKKYIDIAVKYAREKIRKRLSKKYKEFAYYMKYATYKDFQNGDFNQTIINKIDNFCRKVNKWKD